MHVFIDWLVNVQRTQLQGSEMGLKMHVKKFWQYPGITEFLNCKERVWKNNGNDNIFNFSVCCKLLFQYVFRWIEYSSVVDMVAIQRHIVYNELDFEMEAVLFAHGFLYLQVTRWLLEVRQWAWPLQIRRTCTQTPFPTHLTLTSQSLHCILWP